jgi:hypothetical protein
MKDFFEWTASVICAERQKPGSHIHEITETDLLPSAYLFVRVDARNGMHTTSLLRDKGGLGDDQRARDAGALLIVSLLERQNRNMGLWGGPESSAGSKDDSVLQLAGANLDRGEER